jgi:hypothetical protein
MTSRAEFLAEAIEILEDHKDGEDIQGRAYEFLQRYYASLERKPARIGLPQNPYITQQFEKAKEFVRSGMTIKDACAKTGLTRDQWNRRMKMQKKARGEQK